MAKTFRQIEAPDDAEALFKEYALAEAALQQAKDAMAPLRKRVVGLFPSDTPGDFEIVAGKWSMKASVPESVKWDADELTAFYGATLPAHVKRSLSIPEADFRRLPSEDRAQLASAREIGVGSVKLDLSVK